MVKKRTREEAFGRSDPAEQYAIGRIIKSRRNADESVEYLIEWKDRPASEQSWQSVDDLFSKKKSPPEVSRPNFFDFIANFFALVFITVLPFQLQSEC